MNLGLYLARQFSNRWIFLLQPFPYRGRILFVRSSHRLLWRQSPGSQIASHRPHRNLQIKLSGQQLSHRFPRPQRKGQAQLVRATADNVAHRRGCLMRCQSRNGRPSSTSCFQCSTSYAFHKAHPAAHRTSSYSEDPSRLVCERPFSTAWTTRRRRSSWASPGRERASCFSMPDTLSHLLSECHLYYAPISNETANMIEKMVL